MEVALAESLQNYEKEVLNQEQNLIQTSNNNEFEEEQIIQMTIKESIKEY